MKTSASKSVVSGLALVLGLTLGSSAEAAPAGTARVARGAAFVQAHCSVCHAVGPTGASAYPPAPPFRTLHERYNVENLAEAFAEGVVVAHKGPVQMPEFMLSPEEVDDLIAYLKSLEPSAPPRTR
jgi:cytochrome c